MRKGIVLGAFLAFATVMYNAGSYVKTAKILDKGSSLHQEARIGIVSSLEVTIAEESEGAPWHKKASYFLARPGISLAEYVYLNELE